MQILTIVISVLTSVVSGTALFLLQRSLRKKDTRDEQREKDKAKENILIIKSINAVGHLTVANAIALRDGKTNGEMHSALDEYEAVDNEMYNYLLERNAQN
jgi:type II secretory pathway component PulJ